MAPKGGTQRGDGTKAVHGDTHVKEGTLSTPIHQTSTFVAPDTQAFDDIYEGRREGHVYTRYSNPTLASAAHRIALLERAERGYLFASGMGAVSAVALTFGKSGGRILAVEDTYGGATTFFKTIAARAGIKVERFSTTDPKDLERKLAEGPADLVYLESPTNPTLRLTPIKEMAALARQHGVVSVIDSTFATPVNSRPIELGVDLVFHSATKYLSGHSDITAGVVVGGADLMKKVEASAKSLGSTLDPHAAFLLERGLKTLHLRVARANANAQAVAEALMSHAKVARVHYPGLPGHPQHALARAQMPGGYGGLLSFDLPGGKAAAAKFADHLQLVANAASLGGVESLVSIPVVQSHRGQDEAQLARQGIVPGTVRLACGVEDAADIVADVLQALERV